MNELENKLNDVSKGQMGTDENDNVYFGLHPMMPRRYSAAKRAELREFERRILTGSNDKNVKPRINLDKDIER